MVKTKLLIYIAFAISILAWASSFAAIRVSLEAYSPGHVILARLLIGSILLGIYALVTKIRLPKREDLPVIIFLGLCGFTIYQIGLAFGEVTVSAGVASLLNSFIPVFTALIAVIFIKEKITLMGWLGIIIGFIGVVIILLGQGIDLQFAIGALFVLISTLSESFYFVFQKPYLGKYSSIELTSYTIWAGTLLTLIFAPGFIPAVRSAPTPATLSLVYLGVVPTVLAYLTWNYALARVPASMATTILYTLPVAAIIIAWFWIAEVPSLVSIFGGVITLAGVIAVNWKGYNQA